MTWGLTEHLNKLDAQAERDERIRKLHPYADVWGVKANGIRIPCEELEMDSEGVYLADKNATLTSVLNDFFIDFDAVVEHYEIVYDSELMDRYAED